MNEEQRKIIHNALGLLHSDKIYRNRYCVAHDSPVLNEMVRQGWMVAGLMTGKVNPCSMSPVRVQPSQAMVRYPRMKSMNKAVRIDQLTEALKDTLAHLVAATSLLERGGKEGAPSDRMFNTMVDDYNKSIERARAVLNVAPSIDPYVDLLEREITYEHYTDDQKKALKLALKWYHEFQREKAGS